MNLTDYWNGKNAGVEKALKRLFLNRPVYAPLKKAMAYALFSGGKRVRPFLVLESSRVCGAAPSKALPFAAAVEMIHTYSLIHDDLPDMDNADMRRGKPSVHKQFGNAMAILAGDALLTLAFETAALGAGGEKAKMSAVGILARCAGDLGMVGGQAMDIQGESTALSQKHLENINRLKTGELITASVYGAAVWSGGRAKTLKALKAFARSIGFLYQLVDDIIDRQGYYRLLPPDKLQSTVQNVKNKALRELAPLGSRAYRLRQFTEYLANRES